MQKAQDMIIAGTVGLLIISYRTSPPTAGPRKGYQFFENDLKGEG